MPLHYSRKLTWRGHGLQDGQPPQVLSMSINPEGKWLVSGGLDGYARIWSLSSGDLLGEIYVGYPVSAVEWPTHRREYFYLAYSTGKTMTCSVVGVGHELRISGNSVSAHEHGVVQRIKAVLAQQGDVLVTSTATQVRIWRADYFHTSQWQRLATLPSLPTEYTMGQDEGPIVSSVHWVENPVIADDLSLRGRLLCTYMWHGIVCWDIDALKPLWRIPLAGCGFSDLAPDGRHLATLQIRHGLAIYDVRSRALCESVQLDSGSCAVPLPVMYIHGGHAVVTGTYTGNVRIWNTDGRYPHQMQKLRHDQLRVPALAAYSSDVDARVILASCTFDGYIYIWNAELASRARRRLAPLYNLALIIAVAVAAWTVAYLYMTR